ncbi:YggT family protein [Desulfosarcina sp. OttesenSCG-928-A07]|nr:YggT family protein [Desulfosarcina sp. OttesenSCG-928-G17]MDL2328306.1 YggT family protein [Desulfosarcina sp. OttesenSCG-928-A07]
MYSVGYFLVAVARILDVLLILFMWLVFLRAIFSWVNVWVSPYHPVMRFLRPVAHVCNVMTEPVFRPIRARLPLFFGGMDFTPMIVILVIIFLDTFLVNSLLRMAVSLISK